MYIYTHIYIYIYILIRRSIKVNQVYKYRYKDIKPLIETDYKKTTPKCQQKIVKKGRRSNRHQQSREIY